MKDKTPLKMIKEILSKIYNNLGRIISSFLCSYIITSIFNIFNIEKSAEELSFVNSVIPLTNILFMLVLFVVFFLLSMADEISKILYYLFFVSVVVFASLIICENDKNIYLAMGVVSVVCFFTYYLIYSGKIFNKIIKIDNKISLFAVTIIFVVFTIFFSVQTVNRYRGFSASCFDFGIFAQMYENMAKTGIPYTTCERNAYLSHMFIHFSPIFYLTLPIYFIARNQAAICVIQALMVFGSVFPLYLICKKYKFANIISLIIVLIFVLTPGIVSPLFYDFHENKFLPFFLLWFIYFFESEKYKPAYLFLFFTLMIKEDAFIYPLFILLYYLIFTKKYKQCFICLGIIFIYAAFVMSFMRIYSYKLNLSTQLNSRYGVYLLNGQKSFVQIIANIFNNPAYFFKVIFGDGEDKRFKFIIYTLGSMVFLPLINKDFKKLILVVPFVAINLMTNWGYQYDIGFQYTYGPIVLLFYMFITNIAAFDEKKLIVSVICVLCASGLFTYNNLNTRLIRYTNSYNENKEVILETEEALDKIPKDVSVTSETFILPHLIDNVEELYQFPMEEKETDYVVLPASTSNEKQVEFKDKAESNDYSLVYSNSRIEIYKKSYAPDLN